MCSEFTMSKITPDKFSDDTPNEFNTEQITDDGIIDPEMQGLFGWQKQDTGALTYKMIVMNQIDLVRREGSKEMIKGGETYVWVRELGKHVPIKIPDQRHVYAQCVSGLYDLLIHYFDAEAKKKLGVLMSGIENAYRTYLKIYLQRETWLPFKEYATRTGIIPSGKESRVGDYTQAEMDEFIYQSYRKIYQELVLLFKRKNELSNVHYIRG